MGPTTRAQSTLLDKVLALLHRHPLRVNALWAVGSLMLSAAVCFQKLFGMQSITLLQAAFTLMCAIISCAAIMIRHRRGFPALATTIICAAVSAVLGDGRAGVETIWIVTWTIIIRDTPRRAAFGALTGFAGSFLVGTLLVQHQKVGWFQGILLWLGPLLIIDMVAVLVRARSTTIVERQRLAEQQAEVRAVAERLRIAADMHDIIGHGLTSIINLTDVAMLALEHDDIVTVTESVERANELARNTLMDSRAVISRLRGDCVQPTLRPQPGLGQLAEIVEPAERAGVTVRLEETGQRPGGLLEVDAYRIIQESVTNVLRHGVDVSRITIVVRHDPMGTRIVVSDDGAGTDAGPQQGSGLSGMTERARAHGGTLTAGPTGHGWRVDADLRKAES